MKYISVVISHKLEIEFGEFFLSCMMDDIDPFVLKVVEEKEYFLEVMSIYLHRYIIKFILFLSIVKTIYFLVGDSN